MSDFSDSDCDTSSEPEATFNRATLHIQTINNVLLPNDLLELYALYKQSTVGKCNIEKPGILSIKARSKWNAWNDLGNMNKSKAKQLYIEKVALLDPKWNPRSNEKIKSQTNWVVHSVHMPPSELGDTNLLPENEKTAFDYVKEQNLDRLKEISNYQKLDILDETGMGLIHWATDRNSCEILDFLLLSGANVNLQDSDGQTALHYASSCGHEECIKILLKFGADKEIVDFENQTCTEVAEDENVRQLLTNYMS